jgi:transposase
MLFVGLDVHQKQSTYCVLDADGKELRTRTVRGHWSKILAELAEVKEPWAVCFEASVGYGVLERDLSRIARRVVVAHPGQLRLIFRSSRKNDRVDAQKLAKLLFLDEVPSVWVPPMPVQAWRRAVEDRRRLIAQRTATKNSLRALLRGLGLAAPRGLWSRQGRGWLADLELADPNDRLRRDLALDRLEMLEAQVRRISEHLNRIARPHPGVALLRSIPGVGPRTAEAVVAYVDQASRFGRIKAIGRYFGIVPAQDASAQRNRMGHITREGPASVRHLAAEAAWQGIRRSPRLRAYFQRIQQDDPKRRKIALTATAHFLLRAMLSMLRTGQLWRETAA